MKDPNPVNDEADQKYWSTHEDEPTILYEYDNKTMFRKDLYSR